jgi:hypothetical protein
MSARPTAARPLTYLGRDLEELQILLSVKSDLLSLHLTVLDVHLIAAQNDWDAFAHAR